METEVLIFITLSYLIIGSLISRKLAALPPKIPPITAEVAHILIGVMFPFLLVAILLDFLFGNMRKKEDE